MCEVGSFCGCISLYKGCYIIGFVTIVAGAIQCLIFSLILFESYDSFSSSSSNLNKTKTVVSEDLDGSSFYSFSSRLCPFGFIPLAKRIKNKTTPDFGNIVNFTTNSNGNNSFQLGSPDDVGLDNETGFNSGIGSTGSTGTTGSAGSAGSIGSTGSSNPQVTNSSITKISCLAPTQGVLWSLVVASAIYPLVGVILMIGVKNGATCLLSTWFFYTVGYNLLALIVALTDGVYTGAADVSSYFVCLVTAYCIIVVDSYYEKLLRNERVENTTRARPSLVVVKSTPASPGGSPEDPPLCHSPNGRHISLPPGYAPYEVNELLLPANNYNRDISAA